MKLSFSTNAFVNCSVFEAVEEIAAIGYEGVEILADAPHLFASSVSREDLERLRSLIAAKRIQVSNINANTAMGYYGKRFWEPVFEPSLANPEDDARGWRIGYTKRCVEFAQTLSCPNVSVTSGRAVPGTPPERSLEILKKSLREVCAYAVPRGVRIGVEYEPGLLVERCGELVELIAEVGAENLGANLDLGHSHVLGEDPERVIRDLGPRIFHIHVEDIRSRKHYHLVPGQGDIDFAMLFSLLDEAGYAGFAAVELYTCPGRPTEAAREAFAHLEPIIATACRRNR
jgi:fructoselysine 3-epimerase